MKVITYAGARFVAGDAVAVALLRAGRALAEARLAENVEVPIVQADGTRAVATFLLGPASQMVTEDAELPLPEPVEPDAVDRLDALTQRLRPSAIVPDVGEPSARTDAGGFFD